MPEKFNRHTLEFADGGINLNVPPDQCPEDQYPYLLNLYSAQAKTIQPRPSLLSLSKGPASAIMAKRVNNQIPGALFPFQRYVAFSDGSIRGGVNGEVPLDSGYSGKPPAMVTAGPSQSPEAWLYVADSVKMSKFRTNQATVYRDGIFPPTLEPSAALSAPLYGRIDDFSGVGGLAAGGIAGAPTAVARVPASTTILSILYDIGTSGWCCLAFTNPGNSYSFIGQGAVFEYGGGTETAVTEQAFTSLSNTTIAAIHYDVGATGLCTIQMATPFQGLERDQMLRLGASEYVRVLSVTTGPDGLYSFRCATQSPIGAGAAISSVPAIRVYLTLTHAAGESVTQNASKSVLTLGASTTQGTGTLTRAVVFDASQIGGRPVTKDDYMHLSVLVDHPELVLFGRVLLDVSSGANDFTHDFYYQPFEQNDFTAASQGTSSQTGSSQQAIALQQIRAYDPSTYYQQGGLGEFAGPAVDDLGSEFENPYANYPITSSMQAATGNSVWTEFLFKIATIQRVGTDETRTLKDIKAVRLELTVSGNVNVEFGSLWVGGTYGPDVLDSTYGVQGFPIYARYRYRSTITGAISVQSPALRSGVLPRRNAVMLTGVPSADPQVDLIDWEVYGGSQNSWHYAGSTPNAATALQYDITNAAILANDPLSSVAFPPVPASDTPKRSVVNTVGTAVIWVSGDKFNTNWAAGKAILINEKEYTLYAPPSSDTQLSVVENIGAVQNVDMVFAEPIIMGQPVPLMWGPDQQGRFFYAGDPYNPGKVYPSNSDADGGADGVSDQTVIELLSSPSDPVMNGAIVDDAAIVLTSNTIQKLQPSSAGENIAYTAIMLEPATGLYARRGMCLYGLALYLITGDGIARWTSGAGLQSITDERLGRLFPHGSIPGVAVTIGNVTVFPPDYSRPDDMRLDAANGYVFFNYVDTNGSRMTLAYRISNGSWWLWQYGLGGAVTHYQEEGQSINTTLVGTADGSLCLMSSGGGDNGTPIQCAVYTRAFDEGDPRNPKVWGDAWLKVNTRGIGIQVSAATDDFSAITVLGIPLISNTPSPFFLDLTTGSVGNLKRNLALLLTWTTASPDASTQTLFYWEVGPWELRPLTVANWQSQPTTHGMDGFQHMRELWIPYQSNVAFNFLVNADGKQYSYPFPASGPNTVKARIDTDPIKGKLWVYGTTGGPASIFLQGIEAKVKMWGSTEGYVSVKPFA